MRGKWEVLGTEVEQIIFSCMSDYVKMNSNIVYNHNALRKHLKNFLNENRKRFLEAYTWHSHDAVSTVFCWLKHVLKQA